MQNILIPIGIMVGLSILGWLTQKLKNSQDRKQVERDRERRVNSPTVPVVPSSGPKAAAGDLNRFMEEIDKLRQRGAPGTPVPPPARPMAKPVPIVAAKRKPRVDAPIPKFETTAAPINSRSMNPADDLPLAAVVSPTFAPPTIKPTASTGGAPVVTAAVRTISGVQKYKERNTGATTPFGRQLVALLGNAQSLPMAVVLQEILGPPKCKQILPYEYKAPPAADAETKPEVT